MQTHYEPPQTDSWQGRTSVNGAYLHERIQPLNLNSPIGINQQPQAFALLGYKCDTGVFRNLGRPGAAEGPDALRKALGKMPTPWESPNPLWDAGNVICPDKDLEKSQEILAQLVDKLLKHGYFPILIGGGHDIAYGHFKGINSHVGHSKTLGIINFDAHLDLRAPHPAPHSGSPFYQIAQLCETEQQPFKYACVGLRNDANPMELRNRANALHVLQIKRSQLSLTHTSEALKKLKAFIKSVESLYLTIDLDGFSSAVAPGVSAASPMGFNPEEIAPFLDLILRSDKLISMDVAELNPNFDRDQQTAILGASLIHGVIETLIHPYK